MANILVNANSAIINTTEDAQFIQLANRSIAEIIDSGNNVRVYQSKDNVYVEAVQVNPIQQFISQSQVNNPGGSDYQVQFNIDGEFAGSNNFTYDPMNMTLSVPNISTPKFSVPNTQPLQGQFLQYGPNGNLQWANANGAGNGSPGVPLNSFQYNNNSSFAGSNEFTINANANSLVFGNNLTITGDVNPYIDANTTTPNVSNYSLGSPTKRWKDLYLANDSLYLGNTKISTDGSNSINTADLFVNDVRIVQLAITNSANSAIIIGGNVPSGQTQPIVQLGGNANTVIQIGNSANSNITSAANGGIILPNVVGGNFSNVTLNNVTVANANISRINNGNSNVAVSANSNVTFGVAGNANVLTVTGTTSIANSFTSNNYILGNATTTISTTRWIGASTTLSGNAILYEIPAANVASIDYHVTATATEGANSRQVSKILAVNLGDTTNYVEYGGMWVGPQIVDIFVTQANGNIQLYSNAFMANTTIQYNIVLSIYN